MPVCCGSLVLNAIVPMTPSTDENLFIQFLPIVVNAVVVSDLTVVGLNPKLIRRQQK